MWRKSSKKSPGRRWLETKDGDPAGCALYHRHYSYVRYRRKNPKLFVGPGYKIVLLTADGSALFVWRKFRDKSGQQGVNCAVFRNEGPYLSSELILEAEQIAWERWPGARLYTYVNPRKIRSVNPGCCFKKAGWRICGRTKKRKYLILEKLAGGFEMQGNHIAFTIHVPGTLTADIASVFKAPFPLQLVSVSAGSSDDTNASLKIGTMADDDAYMTAASIHNSGSPAEFGRTDFVDDQFPHIPDGTLVKFTLDHDGTSGSAAKDYTLVAIFSEG